MKYSLCYHIVLVGCFSYAGAQENPMAFADSLVQAKQYSQAIAKYNRILEKDPKDEMALRGRAYCYYFTDAYDKAEQDYRNAIAVNPKCVSCYSRLIDMRNFLGKTDAAMSLADSCIVLFDGHKDQGNYKIQKAYLLFGKGNDLAAELLIDEVVNQYPDSAKVYYYRADFRYRTNSKSGALSDINKAIAMDSSFASFYTMKAKIYLTIDYIDEAFKLTNKAIGIDSNLAEAYWLRANIYSYNQKPNKAVQDMQIVLSKDSSNWQYYSFLSEIYYTKKHMDSMCWCTEKALSILSTEKPSEELEKATIFFKNQNSTFCDNTIAGYYFQRGVAMYNIGLYDSAVSFYSTGLKKSPKHPILQNFRANAYIVLQKWDEAITDYYASIKDNEALEKAINERFNNQANFDVSVYARGFVSSTYAGLSEAFMNKKKFDKALEMADSAINIAPLTKDIPLYQYYNQKGRVYMAQGLYDDAYTNFEKTKTVAPDNPLGYMNMALVLANKALGKKEIYGVFSVSTNHNNILGFNYNSKPIKLTDNKKRFLKEALTYCDMAVNIAENNAKPYLIRGYIKHLLGNSTACEDVRKAMYLGNVDAAAYYQSICR